MSRPIVGNSPGTAINSNTAIAIAEQAVETGRMAEAIEQRGWTKPAMLISQAAKLLSQASAAIMDSIDAYEEAVERDPCLEVVR